MNKGILTRTVAITILQFSISNILSFIAYLTSFIRTVRLGTDKQQVAGRQYTAHPKVVYGKR